MNKIQEVKQRADIVRVAEYFGIKKKQVCPFHKEKTPSFSISQSRQIFHCFSCEVGGDCITLVSKILNINAYESAKQINQILGLGVDFGSKISKIEINQYKNKQKIEEIFKEWENKTFQLLCDYLHLLWKWEEEYKPQNPEEDVKDLFVEAMHNKDYIDYLIENIFINGTNENKIWFWKHEKKVVRRIESRVRTFRTINK